MTYKVLITTSGVGSRLKSITQKTNKALIKIAGKPAIEYILEKYPLDTEFVITLGYLGQQVKKFLLKNYPERKFSFAQVDNYDKPGSSLGYSMLCAKSKLQCPFIFHCCDTLTDDDIPAPDRNWVAGYKVDKNADQYRTHNIKKNKVVWINDKGVKNFDYVHIGLVGIKDYGKFWQHLVRLYKENPKDESLNDTFIINEMLKDRVDFDFVPMKTWYDTGNPQALKQTVRRLKKKARKS